MLLLRISQGATKIGQKRCETIAQLYNIHWDLWNLHGMHGIFEALL